MFTSTDIVANLLHLALFALASGFFGYALWKRLRTIAKGQSSGQLASWEGRIRSLLLNVILQIKLFKSPVRGFMHAAIFYGFIVYLLHTGSQMVAGNLWLPLRSAGIDPYQFRLTDYIWLGFDLSLSSAALLLAALLLSFTLTMWAMLSLRLGKRVSWQNSALIQWFFLLLLIPQLGAILLLVFGNGAPFYELILQYFSLLVLVALFYFAYRRWIRRAKGLDVPSSQSMVVLLLIATLMLSTLFNIAAEGWLNGHSHSNWIKELSLWLLVQLGMSDPYTTEATRNFTWWLHISIVFVFMVYVPLSKHSHLVFAPINYLLVKKRPWGQLSQMDLEAEDAVWGAGHVGELPWKSLLDGVSCIECGRCTVECPANRTGKPLDPKKIMVDIKHAMLENQEQLIKGDGGASSPIIGQPYISEEELWGCTSCHACVEACPVGNNQLDAIMEMRRHLVLSESRFPPQLQTAFQNMENQSNPWGIGAHSRADWCSDLGVRNMAENPDAELLYWVGCAASFDDRNKKIARSFVSILQQAKVNFAILGREENCTGDSARRGGNEYLYQTLAQSNIETLNRYKVKKIVTACPHCYNTLKNEYPQMGGNYEVQHHSDFIDDLLRKKRIKMNKGEVEKMRSRRAVYHDSCYLGRYNEIFEEPRRLVKRSLGIDIAEASDQRRNSLCCGAGGAQMWMEEKYERVNMRRSEQLINTGADTIATACPFCITMINDGVKNRELADKIKVVDVAELVAASMEGGKGALQGGFSQK